MKLRDYLDQNGLTPGQFAKVLGLKRRATAYEWVREKKPKIPSRHFDQIAEATGGAVTANDFYGITESSRPVNTGKR